MVEVAIRSMLLADAGVAAIVAERVHPFLLPEGATLPALTYVPVTSAPDDTQEGPSGIVEASVQVDAWAAPTAGKSGYANAAALALAVRDALLGKRATSNGYDIQAVNNGRISWDPPDVDTGIWHAIVEIDVIARRL